MTNKLQQNYPQFFELNGTALNDGYIYIGVDGLDPTTNAIPVYLDASLTTPISQPLRTTGGYVYYNGNPVSIYFGASNYSITVKNSLSSLIYTNLSAYTMPFVNTAMVVENIAELKTFSNVEANQIEVLGYYTKGDGGDGTFYWDATSTEADNGGTIIQATGITTGRWKRVFSGAVNVKWFGAVGDGVTDDTVVIQKAKDTNLPLIFTKGIYLCSSMIFNKNIMFEEGAILKVIDNSEVVINNITAGDYIIFDTQQDFINSFEQNTVIKILNSVVKADWFCKKVKDIQDIKTIPDQTNNLLKAFRASAGNFVNLSNNVYWTEYPAGKLELGLGFYRIDKNFTLGKLISPNYYKITGFSFIGQGSGSTFLVRTDLNSTLSCFTSFYASEKTEIGGFKIVAYNPDGANDTEKYNSKAKALVELQGDSLLLRDIWVAGAQTSITDTNGNKRDGIGIQFNSCIDTYMDNIFIELCSTGIAFYSSVVGGTNIELYATGAQAIGIGNFISDYPDTQTTGSIINLVNVQAQAIKGNSITVIESSYDSCLSIDNSIFNGYNSEFGLQTGIDFLYMSPSSSVSLSLTNSSILNFTNKTFSVGLNCAFGNQNRACTISNTEIRKQLSDISSGVLCCPNSAITNAYFDNCSFTEIFGNLFIGVINNNASSQVTFRDCYLSRFIGKSDIGPSRALVNGAGNINIINLHRDIGDTTLLNQVAYWGSGRIYVDLPSTFPLLTRTISGDAIKVMPQITTFL